MIERNYCEICGRPKLAVRLCTVAPHSPTDPFGRDSLSDLIHRAGPVAMRNNARIGHA